MPTRDFYAVLGVEPDAGPEEIKSAFRKEAARLHPDRNPGDAQAEASFKELNSAYQVLSDEGKKRAYDEARNLQQVFGARASDPWVAYHAARGSPDMKDIFDSFFVNPAMRRPRAAQRGSTPWGDSINPTRGKDVEREITISFEESFTGTVKAIRTKFGGDEQCDTCKGNGGMPGSRYMPCGMCAGGSNPGTTKCRNCQGHGDVPTHVCTTCSGSGAVSGSAT